MICKQILSIPFLNEPKLILLHTVKWFLLLCITNDSISHLSFVHSQFNNPTVLFKTIQFNVICLHTVYMPYSSIWIKDMTLPTSYHSRSEWIWEQWQGRGTLYSPKLHHCWNLTIKLFSFISRTLVGWVLPFCRDTVDVFYSPSWLGNIKP